MYGLGLEGWDFGFQGSRLAFGALGLRFRVEGLPREYCNTRA